MAGLAVFDKEEGGMLFITYGFVLFSATVGEGSVKGIAEKVLLTAVCYITSNSAPPPGTETPVRGEVMMTQPPLGMGPTTIHIHIKGLPPNTVHGFHIHEYGDTFSDGCQSTGSHYNPLHMTHGAPQDKIRHFGDLGNVVADKEGVVNAVLVDPRVSLFGPFSVVGRAFVIHEKIDDLGQGTGPLQVESLKTGNAGARLGCGVIRLAPVNIGQQDPDVETS
ncbi:superoxide dismutase [Cu-Zn], chloroplastic-like [Pocillopora damicornis]|uniref:superoxide dismutase [Cu-Zn], chloroplastic-like n=1 Tax=Pocillopora damicornis TaxID=46731 RepID=UPI000F54E562|nr:superoxide dismutase [Cu-Zn], chloroplastic-like [Pocillopora damicornis]